MSKLTDFIRKVKKHPFTSAVILAAGDSLRMNAQDKTAMPLGGKPVLARALEVFQASELVDEIVVVTKSEKIEEVAGLCQEYGITKAAKILVGGSVRQESALAGLSEIDERAKFAAIHDGARPLVTVGLVEAVLHAAYLYNAAAPFTPVGDTIKEADGNEVVSTPSRGELVAVQTPQCFSADLIKGALTTAILDDKLYTDDCAALEALGVPVKLVAGDAENIKLTSPLDFVIAEAILTEREARQCV